MSGGIMLMKKSSDQFQLGLMFGSFGIDAWLGWVGFTILWHTISNAEEEAYEKRRAEAKAKAAEKLYHWQRSNCDSFTSKIFDMFCKADFENLQRLAASFPMEYEVWKEWHDSPTEDAFFARYKLGSEQ